MFRQRSRVFAWAISLGLVCLAFAYPHTTRSEARISRSQLIARAIGRREAIVLVTSARTGRLLASHDLRDARRLLLLPGSAIKPWTALALLRAGVVTAEDRINCRRVVPGYGPRFACSHPRIGHPFGIRTALAVSCNYFFLTVSERLPRAVWIHTLASYGLHADTGSSGRNLPLMAIGATGIHVTPWNLLQAWRKLVWRLSHSGDPELRLVRQGLIECVRSGTGRAAQVPGWEVMGKTGTVAEIPDGRTHAWFLAAAPARNPRLLVLVATARGSGEGDAAVIAGRLLRGWSSLGRTSAEYRDISANQRGTQRPKPGPTHSAAVLLAGRRSERHAAGAPGEILLQLIRPVSALRLRVESSGTIEFDSGNAILRARNAVITTGPHGWVVASGSRHWRWRVAQLTLRAAAPMRLAAGARRLTVPGALVLRRSGGRGEVLARLGMEAYVAGVVSGEASNLPFTAQQAMAVLARTWARSHRGRHRKQGFDFCSTTHCQVWRWTSPDSAPRRAAASTRGEEVDYHGRPAQVFYSANCGGETEAGGPPWTRHPEPYLVAQPDPYCLRHPRSWQFRIRRDRMARWLVRKGLFRHLPTDLRIQIARRDRSGRAVWLSLSGPPVRMVSADSFRFTVDRSFGWNRIESTLFTVRQTDGYIIFSGRGLGHGVGLCQAGAGAMARQGTGWRAILAHYFPGTRIVRRPDAGTALRKSHGDRTLDGKKLSGSDHGALLQPISYKSSTAANTVATRWHFLVDGRCQIRYDGPRPMGVIEWCPRFLRHAQHLLERRARGQIRLIVYATPAEFIRTTGEPGWKAAITRGSTIRLQPEGWLRRRGRLRAVLRHELLLAVMQARLRRGVDACEQEGLVLVLTGEGTQLAPVKMPANFSEARINHRLLRAHSAREFSSAMAACYQVARSRMRRLGRRAYLERLLR